MIRRLLFILALGATGCVASKQQAQAPAPAEFDSASASALAFDTPVTADYPLLGLARAGREPAAFAGYQDSVVEYFSVWSDDHRSNDPWCNTVDRESVSVKTGVRYR
jgi:hypothetical protein